MEGYIGEIRLFAAGFAPKNWAYCAGQILSVSSNTALFSILGNTYGGDAKTKFGLPDLRGRSAIGAGQGPGLPNYYLGETDGIEQVTLSLNQMPMHNHQAVTTPGSGGSANATLNGINANGNSATPGGNLLAQDAGVGAASYTSSGTLTAMNSGSVVIDSVVAPLPQVTITPNGEGVAHPNLQPLLAVNYIICQYGTFPSRN